MATHDRRNSGMSPITRIPIEGVEPAELVPPPSLFLHASALHGQTHVGRVLVHAFRLVRATGLAAEAPRLWAAVYLHDLARLHDGDCEDHGPNAVRLFGGRADLRALFARAGVRDSDYPAIGFAVSHHSSWRELPPDAPHETLAALLEDADALDRVRLGDLDPSRLRLGPSAEMVPFAKRLYDETDGSLPQGPDYFARLWPRAVEIERSLGRTSATDI